MYTATTHDIEVAVEPFFLEDRSDPATHQYFWAYRVTIANHGERVVKLIERHWRIVDGNGHVEEVHGEGVVGEQPLLSPGDSYQYTSGCPLSTPSGIMEGCYTMIDAANSRFDITIPTFSLDIPGLQRSVN